MDIDSPDVVAEVKSAFERYERAISRPPVASTGASAPLARVGRCRPGCASPKDGGSSRRM